MEEASVAGESPDRSKQRESSAEPTSGSAGPVPEARKAAADPRLAVARESAPGDAGGRVDTATQVLSVRELSEGSAEDGDAGDAGGPEERDRAEAEGDERLRAAVAAWVTAAPAETDEDARENAEQNGDDAAGEDGSGADSDGETDGEASTEAAEEASADVAGEAAVDADEATGAEPDREASTEAAEEASADTDAESAGETDEQASTEGAEEASADAAEETAEEAAVDADEASAEAAEEASADAHEAAEEAAADANEATDTEPDGGTDEQASTEAAEEASADAAEETAEEAAADAAEVGDTADEAAADAEDAGDADAAQEADGSDESHRDGDGTPKPVDQPTAVFRAARPAKPAVDQPTTMLKLGDVKKAPKEDAEGDAEKAASEAEAERTSKFVALKPLDAPETRKPRPAEATTALPRVPADTTAPVPQVGPERTTQQPLPPKPPLDLLAELTNTPPPPETALRTLVRRVKIWTPLVLLLVIVFAIVQAVRPLPTPTLELTAEESYTFDGKQAELPWPGEGQGWMDVTGIGTMGNFGEQKPVAIGSVAKAMTAYIILKEHPLKAGEEGPNIEVDATAEKEGGYDQQGESTLNTVKKGDQLTERQAISAIMIPSANNIARLLARWDAGSEEAFVEKMNDTAKELGMKNTTYTDPSGLEETTVSTAEDQVKLGNELVRIPALVEITKLPSWTDPSGQKWRNWNTLVPYDGAIGIKTGTTTAAGGNLLFAATKDIGGETVTVVGAILGQHTAPIIDTVNAVSRTAMLGAQDALTSAKILKKGDVVGYVDDQLGGRTPVVVTEDVAAVGWAGLKVELSFASDDVPHTAKAGTKVGTLTVGDGSGGAVEVPVALQSDLAEPGFTAKLTRIG
ncbi:D-alanyl-D-alanine carboxypeptidase [Streptomyces sp. PSKA30]|uniref:D-alanyl-D-alanine carboxypeptidase n=1 Tax=Streptomyces sp. PSKA30 TaxID=2874597 RepID=UPI001CD0E98A|nr:D-alanyl-D-alanine carboxypeptidase [Streptomyces sp. PSKA30]MBZ9639767.1 D-alanyl-D-alanine carboxypeptidase [Streptomyces sp. PSKA30]